MEIGHFRVERNLRRAFGVGLTKHWPLFPPQRRSGRWICRRCTPGLQPALRVLLPSKKQKARRAGGEDNRVLFARQSPSSPILLASLLKTASARYNTPCLSPFGFLCAPRWCFPLPFYFNREKCGAFHCSEYVSPSLFALCVFAFFYVAEMFHIARGISSCQMKSNAACVR